MRHFWAAPFEIGGEFGGRGLPSPMPTPPQVLLKYRVPASANTGANTTIAIVATDAQLTKAQAKRVAICAHDGFARAIWPAHTPHDGDLVFCLATGRRPLAADLNDFIDLCALAGATVSRAIARGVYLASPAPTDIFPTWREKFGKSA